MLNVRTVAELFAPPGVRFQIPIYQRHYVWDRTNWQQLWEDFQNVMIDRGSRHFTGVIAVRDLRMTPPCYDIVDGQQRLTTFQIIFCAILTEARRRHLHGLETRARNLTWNPDDSLKLFLTGTDGDAFRGLFSHPPEVRDGNLLSAYEYYAEQVRDKPENSLQEMLSALSDRFEVGELKVGDPTDETRAARFFECLNTRGRRLSDFDLVRNDLFLRAGATAQTLYEEHWPFDADFWKESTQNKFLRVFLLAKSGAAPSPPHRGWFSIYTDVHAKASSSVEDEMQQFAAYSKQYKSTITEKPAVNLALFLVQRGRADYLDDDAENADGGWIYTTWLPVILRIRSQWNTTIARGALDFLDAYLVQHSLVNGIRAISQHTGAIIEMLNGVPSDHSLHRHLEDHLARPSRSQIEGHLKQLLADRRITDFKQRVIKYILFRTEAAAYAGAYLTHRITTVPDTNYRELAPAEFRHPIGKSIGALTFLPPGAVTVNPANALRDINQRHAELVNAFFQLWPSE